jgi:hypothetical protein
MLGAPPDPLKLSSATPVVLHASAGPPAKRVRPGFVHGRKADMRAVCSELLQATQAPAAVPRLQCPTNERERFPGTSGEAPWTSLPDRILRPENRSGNLLSEIRFDRHPDMLTASAAKSANCQRRRTKRGKSGQRVASQAARAPVAMISSRETVENDHLYFSPCTRVS